MLHTAGPSSVAIQRVDSPGIFRLSCQGAAPTVGAGSATMNQDNISDFCFAQYGRKDLLIVCGAITREDIMYPKFLKRPQNILIFELNPDMSSTICQINWAGYDMSKGICAYGVTADCYGRLYVSDQGCQRHPWDLPGWLHLQGHVYREHDDRYAGAAPLVPGQHLRGSLLVGLQLLLHLKNQSPTIRACIHHVITKTNAISLKDGFEELNVFTPRRTSCDLNDKDHYSLQIKAVTSQITFCSVDNVIWPKWPL